jgi:NAD(P)-dependent dehydrogenase (short-subunit alcohol dehydrogenase family)
MKHDTQVSRWMHQREMHGSNAPSVQRHVVHVRATESTSTQPRMAPSQRPDWKALARDAKFMSARRRVVVLLTEDRGGRAAIIAAALRSSDTPVRVVLLRHGSHAACRERGCYEANLLCTQSLQDLQLLLRRDLGAITDLWHLQALDGGLEPHDSSEVRSLFALTQVFGAGICNARGTLFAITEKENALGLSVPRRFNPGQAAIPGLIKSLALEWPAAVVRCWSIASGTNAEALFVQALQELAAGRAATATSQAASTPDGGGYFPDNEVVPLVRSAAKLALTSDSVILLSGGPRGIAAEVAHALTADCGGTIIVTGQSALPEPVGKHTAQLQDAAEIKRALARTLTPKEVTSQYEQLLAAHEMRHTFARLRAVAEQLEYHSLDVRDTRRLTQLVEDIYRRHGRLDGVVHVADGVDAAVAGTSGAAFDSAYDTAVIPALTLAEVLRPQALQFLVLLSPIAYGGGCSHCAGFAAANEALNKLAWQLNGEWPGRVISMGWKPWSGGLATRHCEQIHALHGFDRAPLEAGCQYFMDELLFGDKRDAEMVIHVPGGTSSEAAVQRALAI